MDVNDKIGHDGSNCSDVDMQSDEAVKSSRLSITWPRVNLGKKIFYYQHEGFSKFFFFQFTKYLGILDRFWQRLSGTFQPNAVHLTNNVLHLTLADLLGGVDSLTRY